MNYPAPLFSAMCVAIAVASLVPSRLEGTTAPVYRANWESLAAHPMAEWLLDAKFGLYAHWGVYSVPAFQTEWYGKHMYQPDSVVNRHHRATYGDPEKFGYKEFIPQFKAEQFDPDEWAKLFKAAGARYAGLAVVHHDGFLLWDSTVNRWNAKQMGPRRDLYGELVAALRREGLKTIATEHHIRTFNWYLPGSGLFGEGLDAEHEAELRRSQLDLVDPAHADLYWNSITGNHADFMREWRAKLVEVIDKYRPDVLWFDGGDFQGKATEQTVLEVLAHFHNSAAGRGQEVEVLNKLPVTMKFNFPENFGILTFEEGRDRPAIVARPWIDDMRIGDPGWCYVEGQNYKPAREIIAGLADRVARGGGLLLNLSPKADGTIPEPQKDVLQHIGRWLQLNGEAIYESRPWTVHAEGDETKLRRAGRHPKWDFSSCDASDVRFTRSKDGTRLYAILLGWPGTEAAVAIRSINATTCSARIARIQLLGDGSALRFSQNPGALEVFFPRLSSGTESSDPVVLRIEFDPH